MKYYRSDFSSQPKFIRYYGLDDFPEAHFLIESEFFDTSLDETNNTESFLKEIFFALGIITILVVLSVCQLYLALEVTQSKPKNTQSRTSHTITIPDRKVNNLHNH